MAIFQRYVVREMVQYFAIVLAAVSVLFIAIDYLGTMDEFFEADISLLRALFFVILKLPFMITMFIPVGLLLSVLIVIGLMRKNNELTALKASGVSTAYLLKPVLGAAVLAGVALFVLAEGIAPVTMARATHIQRTEIRRSALVTVEKQNIWLKLDRQILHLKYYNPSEAAAYGVSLNTFDDNFRLIRRLDAEKAVFDNGQWVLFGLLEQVLDGSTGRFRVDFFESRPEPLALRPEDLKKVVKKSEEMSFGELRRYIQRVEAEGYDATTYRVDLHAKVAFPFVCVVMGLLGVAVGIRSRLGRGIAGGIAAGVGVAFLFWITYSFCLSLGYGELLPPWIAAWTANFLFLCGGWVMMLRAD